MKNEVYLGILILVSCAGISQAQWTPDPFCPYPSDHVTRYPYYGNCSVYWECFEGTKYVMECPVGLEFNAPLQQCDTPSIANCDPFASTTSNPNPPTWTTISTSSHQPGPDCPYPSDDLIYYPYVGDCTKYWECYQGNHYLYTCPDGLWWHQELSQCDYPGDFCSNTTIPTTEHTTETTPAVTNATEAPPICDGSSDDQVFYPYPGDCTKYWECSNGQLYLYTCPDGLWWDQSTSQCEYPGDFCSDGTIPTTYPSTPIVECDNEGTSYLPDPNNCHLFIECRDGVEYEVECPTGLYYSEEKNECVLPDQSACCASSDQC